MKKFEDKGELLSHFYDYRIVSCLKCSKPVDFLDLKIACIHCGFNKKFKPMDSWYSLTPITVEIEDFLTTPCCGHTFWAMNLEHLAFVERYVESDLRERMPNINRSLASRLPQWIKSKKNRNEILKGISRLRLKLVENNYKSKKHLTL
ncbi:hypothetical protein [Aureispira sp. CCB-E]|uniref:hypothetical protein n=1 Tax=Aureispira sp. CCB-E TaxID=3051121 RepID=UPI0028689703|nr:hypothetical protein [Aureispira sp. CCB-E]WMX16349.1 hypothetical protein QP953_08220 [Aureispira sp. CCB-E]